MAHDRFLSFPDLHPMRVDFYRELENNWPLVKEFHLRQNKWHNPVIRIYALSGGEEGKEDEAQPSHLPLPSLREKSPYEHVYLTQPGWGKDLLTLDLEGKRGVTRLLVTEEKLEELVCFSLAGWRRSRLTVSAGLGRSKDLETYPGTSNYIKLRPRRSFPFDRNHYRVTVRAREEADCLVKIATEPREIAHTFLALRDWEQAIAYLEKAREKYPEDWETHCLLAALYSYLEKTEAAGEIFSQVERSAPWYLSQINSLAGTAPPPEPGSQRDDTLAPPLRQEESVLPAESALFTSLQSSLGARYFEAGKPTSLYFKQCERASDYILHSAAGREDLPFLYGPYYSLPPGRYRAVFRLRVEHTPGPEPVLRLEVTSHSGGRHLAVRELSSPELQSDADLAHISLPFVNDSWENKLEFRAKALGPVNVRFHWVAVSPDTRALLVERACQIVLARAHTANARGEHAQALSYLQHVSGESRSSPEFQYERALACRALGKWPEAAQALENAVGAVPGNRRALAELGQVYEKLGKPAQAETIRKEIHNKFTPAQALSPESQPVFGEKLRLYGYELAPGSVTPGGEIELKLYLECLSAMEAGLYFFVHFEKDKRFFPADQNLDSSRWKKGEVRTLVARATVPADFPKGEARIVVGVWHPELARRLTARREGKEIAEVELHRFDVTTP